MKKISFKSIEIKDCDSCVFNERVIDMREDDWNRCRITNKIIYLETLPTGRVFPTDREQFPKSCPIKGDSAEVEFLVAEKDSKKEQPYLKDFTIRVVE